MWEIVPLGGPLPGARPNSRQVHRWHEACSTVDMHDRPILVLIVDDEPLLRWAIAETLIARGCGVVEADDAQSAVHSLSDGSRRFDAVVMSYCLRDARDRALLAVARCLSPHSQVVVMTSCVAEDVAREALEEGASQVLQKPVDLEVLAGLVLRAPASTVDPTP